MNEQLEAMMESAGTLYESMSKSKAYSKMIKAQGELMRKTVRQYQVAGFSQEQAFQLVLALAGNGEFKVSG